MLHWRWYYRRQLSHSKAKSSIVTRNPHHPHKSIWAEAIKIYIRAVQARSMPYGCLKRDAIVYPAQLIGAGFETRLIRRAAMRAPSRATYKLYTRTPLFTPSNEMALVLKRYWYLFSFRQIGLDIINWFRQFGTFHANPNLTMFGWITHSSITPGEGQWSKGAITGGRGIRTPTFLLTPNFWRIFTGGGSA